MVVDRVRRGPPSAAGRRFRRHPVASAQHLVAAALAYAAGALIASVSFELFQTSYEDGGPWRAGLAFGAGALAFVVADDALDVLGGGNPTGLALLAGVTIDGIPENTVRCLCDLRTTSTRALSTLADYEARVDSASRRTSR